MTDREVQLVVKLGLKAGMDVCLLHPPEHYWTLLGGDPAAMGVSLIATEGERKADFTHLFASDVETLREAFATARRGMREDGMVWASWPKKSSGIRSRIGRTEVMAAGKGAGLVDVKNVRDRRYLVRAQIRDPGR